MRHTIDIDLPAGRSRKATVTVSADGEVLMTDRADLSAIAERERLAKRLAGQMGDRLGTTEEGLRRKLDKAWAAEANRQREQQAAQAAAPPPVQTTEYVVQDGRISRRKKTPDGEVVVPLCNFAARITAETVRDDGVERSTWLVIDGTLDDGRPLGPAEVSAAAFAGMGWVIESWATRATVYAGMGTKDHLRTALQLLSGDVPRTTVYTHTGWREVDGRHVYLHGGGAIGTEGTAAGIQVCPPEALAGFAMPDPPKGRPLVEAVQASLRLIELAPPRITFPVLAAVYRAALGDTDFSLHMCGATGNYKTEAATLAQQHYGRDMDARKLPANWGSTGNSLEGTAFAAKDALLVVDDFAPSGSVADVQRYHREADRVIRAQGNRSGRQRMRADGTVRPAKPPRGLLLSTGEDIPRGQSIRARMFAVEVGLGDIDTGRLTTCQQDAAAGLYVGAMAGFLAWVAPQYAEAKRQLRAEVERLRAAVHVEGRHRRTSAIAAELVAGWDVFLRFALAVKAVGADEAEALRRSAAAALADAAERQTEHQADAEPAAHFLRLVAAAITSGRAHMAAPDGQSPPIAVRWGWRLETRGAGQNATEEWRPNGRRVGWVEDDLLYLDPTAAYAEAQDMAKAQGESLAVSPTTLAKRLHERGLLAATEHRGGKLRLTVRKQLQEARRYVFSILADTLMSQEVAQVAPVAPDPQKPERNGPLSGATKGPADRSVAPGSGPVAPGSGPNSGDSAAMGHLGHLFTQETAGKNSGSEPPDRGDAWEGD
jgi:hypothetical protein